MSDAAETSAAAGAEPGVEHLISVAEAIGIIDAVAVRPRVVDVALSAAAGLRLVDDLRADRDAPPFDKSVMDGYAVRSLDAAGGAAATLRVVGEVAAGATAGRAVGAGEAMAVMTGAPMPPGADAVVPIEQVKVAADGQTITLAAPARRGAAVSLRGSDVRRGHVVLRAGTRLGAAQAAVAASVGAATLRCYARPHVVVMGTGDEIVPVDVEPGPSQIRSSNNAMLVALLSALGCEAQDLGLRRDDPAVLRGAMEAGLRAADVLLVTGGMSMGAHDYVPRILREMKAELRVTKLRIRPGKPFVFATVGEGKYVFGLPGNPVSTFVCTLRLASRLLARLGGAASAEDPVRPAALTEPLPANGPREFYQPAWLENGRVRPLAWKGSADLFTLARGNALIVRPENAPEAQAGDEVGVMAIP